MSRYGSIDNSYSESSDDANEFEDEIGDIIMLRLMIEYEKSYIGRTPCRTSALTGRMYTLEFLVGHEVRCYENFRMKKQVFMDFCHKLREIGNLSDGKKVSLEEGVAMFLIIVCHNMRHRVVVECFQHSIYTVSKWFRRVLRAICKLGTHILRPRNQGATHPYILNNYKYFPYFKNCIGAIDGTHISAWAPTSKQTAFRGRKILIIQNVLAVCDFDMLFTFVYTGWEGTANDSRVFLDALNPENAFPKPHGDQFYLVDSGFPNMPGYLAPFRSERYHLRDFRDRGRPRGKYELYNYRHSSLRNVIERCFGVLKARFPILKMMLNYPVRRQRQIPTACCTIHNFIRMKHSTYQLFGDYISEDMTLDGQNLRIDQEGVDVNATEAAQMAQVREIIADQMWDNYHR